MANMLPNMLPSLPSDATAIFHRLSSNQEYAPVPGTRTDTTDSKPRVAGVGKAPKGVKKNKHTKPYDRCADKRVHGASRSNKDLAAVQRHISLHGRVASVPSVPWTNEVAGPQVQLHDIEDNEEYAEGQHEDISIDERHEVHAQNDAEDVEAVNTPSIKISTTVTPTPVTPTVPSPQLKAAAPAGFSPTAASTGSDLYIRIPGHLQKPVLPPMTHMHFEDDEIPTDYVRYHLDPHLAMVHRVGAMYQPLSWAESKVPVTGGAQSMAYGIPTIVRGEDTSGTLAASVAGYEPDLLLAVQRSNGSKGKFDFHPIKHVAYAARCRLFPELPSHPLNMTLVHPHHFAQESGYDSDDSDEDSDESDDESSEHLDFDDDSEVEWIPVIRERPASAMSNASVASDNSDDSTGTDASDLSDVSEVSSTDAASDVASADTGAYIHLPIVAVQLPAPETFEIVHHRLHHPNAAWEPVLLGLPLAQALNPGAAIIALDELSTREVNRRLTAVHGVWANMCALGVDDDRIWSQVDRAYKMLLDSMRRRALRAMNRH